MLQDRPRGADNDNMDFSVMNDDGLLTPDQYNSSLE